MRRPALFAVAGGLLLAAGPAAAQALVPSVPSPLSRDLTKEDMACMVVVAILGSQTQDAALRQGATAGFGYYMGKIKAREPAIDLKTRLVAETKALLADTKRLQAEGQRCGEDMKAWGRETQEIGAALKAAAPE